MRSLTEIKQIKETEVTLQVGEEGKNLFSKLIIKSWITIMILKKLRLQNLRTSPPLKFPSVKDISFNKSAESGSPTRGGGLPGHKPSTLQLYLNTKLILTNVRSVLCANDTAELFISNY